MDISEHFGLPELVVLAKEEERTAVEVRFADLVTRQSRFVFRVAYAVLRNPQDAEDVVQDTFFKPILAVFRMVPWGPNQTFR